MRRWALVDRNTNIITNIVLWDGVSQWSPTDSNLDLADCTDVEIAEIGGKFENGEFIAPIRPPTLNELTSNNEVTTEPTVL